MTVLTLGECSKATGVNKSALSRAIKCGQLSATRNDNGSYSVDASELFRVYSPAPVAPVEATDRPAVDLTHPATDASAALLRAQIESLNAMGDLLRGQVADLKADRDKQLGDLRSDRDHWREVASRLLLSPPGRRPWWRRLTG